MTTASPYSIVFATATMLIELNGDDLRRDPLEGGKVRLVAQAVRCRRRHQLRRPPPAKMSPGNPAPTIGPGTCAGLPTGVVRMKAPTSPCGPDTPGPEKANTSVILNGCPGVTADNTMLSVRSVSVNWSCPANEKRHRQLRRHRPSEDSGGRPAVTAARPSGSGSSGSTERQAQRMAIGSPSKRRS
jgi:hypothetical protein